jgi:malonyl CoA-acyl carrier protein transacylase/phosphopantetheinyl transferase
VTVAVPEARDWFDLMDAAFDDHPRGLRPSRAVFPPPGGPDHDVLLTRMDLGPESLFAASQGLLAVLGHLGIRPDAALGHSSGEWSALIAGGVLNTADRSRVVRDVLALNRVYEQCRDDGSIAAAGLLAVGAARPDEISQAIAASDGELTIAMDNCPHQMVLSGSDRAIAAAEAALSAGGAVCERLPFERAYHTGGFAPFADRVREHLGSLDVGPAAVPVWSACSAAPFPNEPEEIRDLAGRQWASRVRFTETVQHMYEAGLRIFLEVGPAARLTGFVRDILHGRPCLALATDPPPGGLRALLAAVGQLFVNRVTVDTGVLFRDRVRPEAQSAPRLATALPVLDVPADLGAQFRVAGTAVGPRFPAGVPAVDGAEDRTVDPDANRAPAGAGAAAAVSAHLRTMEHFLQVQSDVMSAFLGGRMAAEIADHGMQNPIMVVPHAASQKASPPRGPADPLTEDAFDEAAGRAVENTIEDVADERDQDVDVRDLLRSLISDRTGYPAAMITDDLDLEADLGIDSIKRTEIIGVVRDRVGDLRPDVSATLRSLRTLSAIAAAIRAAPIQAAPIESAPIESAPIESAPIESAPIESAPIEAASTRNQAIQHHRPEAGELPWIDEITERQQERLVARHRFDLDRDAYLADHTVERRRPGRRDSTTIGLPLVPLTASLELAAEAAASLIGHGVVIRIEEIAALRWISLEQHSRTVRVVAERRDHPASDEVAVAVSITADDPFTADRPMLSAVVIIADDYPPAPPPVESDSHNGRVANASGRELYGPDGLFHGPTFQVITSLDAVGAHHAAAGLTGPGTAALTPGRRLLTDVALLDGPGQVVAVWLRESATERFDIFPVRVDALELYAGPRTARAAYRCRAAIRELSDDHILSDLDILETPAGDHCGTDGRLVARFSGWRDVRLGLDQRLRDFLGRPDEANLTDSWQPAIREVALGVHGRRVALDAELARTTGGLWLEVLAYAVLRPDERAEWGNLRTASDARRAEWLGGRIAAKEAVRDVLAERGAAAAANADIGIGVSEAGAPQVIAPPDATDIRVSISHSAGVAVAIASDRAEAIGVDLQTRSELVTGLGPIAFAPAEQAWLDSVPAKVRDEWATRFWTAKEAAAKALGTGLGLVPAEFVVEPAAVDPGKSVRATAGPDGQSTVTLLVRCPNRTGDSEPLPVGTVIDHDHRCVAVCLGTIAHAASLSRTDGDR